jgi:hypothetical protein
MSKAKLTRNPFENQNERRRSRVWDDVAPVTTSSDEKPSARPTEWQKKLNDMQVQVDWPEFFDSTVGGAIKKLSRLLNR